MVIHDHRDHGTVSVIMTVVIGPRATHWDHVQPITDVMEWFCYNGVLYGLVELLLRELLYRVMSGQSYRDDYDKTLS